MGIMIGNYPHRKEKEDSATFERTRDNNRGKSVNERIQLAMIEQQSVKNATVMFEGQIFSLQCDADRHTRLMQMYYPDMMDRFEKEEKAYEAIMVKIKALSSEMEEVRRLTTAFAGSGKNKRGLGRVIDNELTTKELRMAAVESLDEESDPGTMVDIS